MSFYAAFSTIFTKPFVANMFNHYIMKRREITFDNFNIFSTFIGYIFTIGKKNAQK